MQCPKGTKERISVYARRKLTIVQQKYRHEDVQTTKRSGYKISNGQECKRIAKKS